MSQLLGFSESYWQNSAANTNAYIQLHRACSDFNWQYVTVYMQFKEDVQDDNILLSKLDWAACFMNEFHHRVSEPRDEQVSSEQFVAITKGFSGDSHGWVNM